MNIRNLIMLLALAMVACANDSPDVAPHATSMHFATDSATVEASSTLQLVPVLTWSDGTQHSATVTYSAAGGTITDAGLYTAGAVTGHYLIIATCNCGLVDTVGVTIAAAGSPALQGTLSITVSGLPAGGSGQVVVVGPNNYQRAVSSSVVLDSLPPGVYAVHADSAAVNGGTYLPAPADQSVTVAASATQAVAFAYSLERAPAPTGLPPHPRVAMTPLRLQFVKQQAAANTTRWQNVKNAAEAQVARGVVYASTDDAMLPTLCVAYLATDDFRYAQRAAVVLTDATVETNNLTGDSGYNYRYLGQYAEGLDWCYTGLTVAQRRQAATWLMNRADWVWPESNPSPHKTYAVTDVTDNYYWGYMMTGLAALAAAGDDTGRGVVSGTDRPTYHQNLILSKWNSVVVPALSVTMVGGADLEGTGYDISGNIARVIDAFRTSGTDLSNPWVADAIRWHLHATMPGYKFFAPIGDQARVSSAPMYIYNRINMLFSLAAAQPGSPLATQVQNWLGLIGQVPTRSNDGNIANEFVLYDPSAPATADLSGLPNGYLASGAGEFFYRQSWTDPNSTVLVFRSGTNRESHSGLDGNSLRIWKGSYWVSGDANIYSASGIHQTTDYYDDMTVGGVGQSHHDGPFIVDQTISDTLVAVRGQAAQGYLPIGNNSGTHSSVLDYLRTVAYLPQQDVFVVVDRTTIVDSTQQKVWRWHMKDVPQIAGQTFRLENANHDARCFGNVLLPTDAALGVQSFGTSNAVTVTLPNRKSDVMVTVLQCTTGPLATFVPTVVTSATGASVAVGSQHVFIPLDETQPVRLITP